MFERPRRNLSHILPPLAVVGVVLSLTACAAPNQAKMKSGAPVETAAYTPAPDSAVPQPGLPGRPSVTDLARGPQRFEGLLGKDVIDLLGDPNFRRHEWPAEVWQYYGPGCILDLFLYANGATQSGATASFDGKVAHAELRGHPGEPLEAACLSRLIDQRRVQRAG